MASGGLINPLIGVAGYAIGTASGPALRPLVQHLANDAWELHTVRPLGVHDAAALWVEGIWSESAAKAEAARTGFSGGRLDALRDLIDNPPDVATMFALWRRNLVSDAEFETALRRLRIEPEWFAAIKATRNVLIRPAELAAMRQQGYIDADYQHSEAALQGVTAARADLMFEAAGLPPGPEAALTMLRRSIITSAEFAQMIREGNTKTKYVDEYLALRRPLLTPGQIVNQRLRGWRDTPWMNDRLADYGFTSEDADDLFKGQGRPITFRQVFIGERRGGVYDGPTAPIAPAFLKSLQESNIRPEWYALAWAQRHSLPSAFVIRGLAQSGDIDAATTRELLMWSGWPAFLIDAVVSAWTGTTDGADPGTVKSARTQALTEIRSAYILGQADDGQAQAWLGAIGVDAPTVAALLPIWNVMREVPQKGLTAAQIKAAFKKLPAQWPRARALSELQELGLTADDAATLLDS